MRGFYAIVGLAFVVVAPVRLAWCAWRDFQHPERWGQDVTRDPRIYLPLAATAATVYLWALWRKFRTRTRT
ncbi:hypothetical protein [Fimbriiglobus ruber]|uniref:Uncharacterized protein n=1 Tax=Fimbriiglobus ruber TaxID=1908690 RepID=A0A225DHP1_9BACT|nr:hypothetical protein [Fimbriiglobus ruber]OWK41001.1 hypothetical protein FRUB_04893 [Fimbriiglobus ruber]